MTSPEAAQSILLENYTNLYRSSEKHDSPDFSRLNMTHTIAELFCNSTSPKRILDIGSGRQALEKQFYITYHNQPWFKYLSITSLDFADIAGDKLLCDKIENVNHIRGNGLFLPFGDNTFDAVVSNLAIDLMPHKAFAEASRVLNPQGYAIFNFHHPSLLDIMPTDDSVKLAYWKYLKENKILFENFDQIVQTLSEKGLRVEDVERDNDGTDRWWVVLARKD